MSCSKFSGSGKIKLEAKSISDHLEFYSEFGAKCIRFYRYKSHLPGYESSASSSEQLDDAAPRMPDIGGFVHHEGVVLKMQMMTGKVYHLQIDSGFDGLVMIKPLAKFPVIPDFIRWSASEDFVEFDIPPHRGDPSSLAKVIRAYEAGKRFHLLDFNCARFSSILERHLRGQKWRAGG
ncbi:unnamed protein product [Polarella glacialis]|uniref:Uncharacterized protein n=1 Tax=Polarella glacialis TaxID=89957 RepID=A0A813GCT2_POLGL|nr:unnamed protein product [Polarella glacialis]